MDPLTLFKQRLRHYTPLTIPAHFRECLSKNPALTIDMVLYDMKINPKSIYSKNQLIIRNKFHKIIKVFCLMLQDITKHLFRHKRFSFCFVF